LKERIQQTYGQQGGGQTEEGKFLKSLITDYLEPNYADFIGKEISNAYLETYSEFGQTMFDRYVKFAAFWIDDGEYHHRDTGSVLDKKALDSELSKIEKPAGIGNPKEFRQEVVRFCTKYQRDHGGDNPEWTSYAKLREVLEK